MSCDDDTGGDDDRYRIMYRIIYVPPTYIMRRTMYHMMYLHDALYCHGDTTGVAASIQSRWLADDASQMMRNTRGIGKTNGNKTHDAADKPKSHDACVEEARGG